MVYTVCVACIIVESIVLNLVFFKLVMYVSEYQHIRLFQLCCTLLRVSGDGGAHAVSANAL